MRIHRFTTGPWVAVGELVMSRTAETHKICECSPGDSGQRPYGENIANARLISAAPDMYALLAEIKRYWGDYVSPALGTKMSSVLGKAVKEVSKDESPSQSRKQDISRLVNWHTGEINSQKLDMITLQTKVFELEARIDKLENRRERDGEA